jgi:hypothetical protein
MLSARFGGERPRFKQLTDWLGPVFDSVIVFDEAHLMKNAVTYLRKEFGIETARVVLGHTSTGMTEVYADKDLQHAAK